MKKGGFQAMVERGRAMAQRQAQAEARRAEQRRQEAQPGGNLEGTPRDLSTPGPAARQPQLPFGGFFTPKSSPHPTGGDLDEELVMSLRKDLETERGRRLALLSEMEDSEQAAMAALKSVKARAEDIEKQRVELETELRVAKAAAEVFEAEKAKHAEAEARNAALEAQNARLQQQVTAGGRLTEEVQPRGDATKLAAELRATQEERRILREQMASMRQALDGAGRDTDARLREQEAARERLAAEKAAAEEKVVEMAAAQHRLQEQVGQLLSASEAMQDQLEGDSHQGAATADANLRELQNQKAEDARRIAALETQMETVLGEKNALRGEMQATEAQLAASARDKTELQAQLAGARSKLAGADREKAALEAQVADLQAQVERAGKQIKGAGIQVRELEARLRGEVEEKRALREQVCIMKEQIADMTDKAEEKLKAEIESRAQLQEMFDQASGERQAAESELRGLMDAAVTEKAGLASDVEGLRAECDRLQVGLKEHRSSVEHMQMMLQGAGDRERALQARFEEERQAGGALQLKLDHTEAELRSKLQALRPLEARVKELEAQRQQAERVADQLRGETKTLLAKMGNQLEMLQDVEQERDLLVQLLRAERETKTNRVAGTPSSNARPVAK